MRMIAKDVCINRPNQEFAVYKMSNHTESERNPVRENLLFSSVVRMKEEGLSNLYRLNVSIVNVQRKALFTHLKVYIGQRSSSYFKKYNFTTTTSTTTTTSILNSDLSN